MVQEQMPEQISDLADLHTLVQDTVGFIVFTVLVFSPDGRHMTRIHSSHPTEYPVGGSKDLATDVSRSWMERCVLRQQLYYGPSKADLRQVFTDYAEIERLGCGSVLNVPVIAGDQSIGALNILGPEYAYSEADLREASVIAERSVRVVMAAIKGSS